MNARIRRKWAREFAACVTVATVLAHARPSFYREGWRKRAQLLQRAARKNLCSVAQANAAKRMYLKSLRGAP